MAEVFLVVGIVLFVVCEVVLCIVQDRQYKKRHNQTVEEDKTDRIATLNSDIERASRRD